ncbi:MAG: TetR/AcrR family transcriptional regulator [Pseudomonadales bacterium]|nr:TetR/AcrR family transcriptional regulator [Pseudomonadales bacterium]
MPNSPKQKRTSRRKILTSAYTLFSGRGYDSVSIDEVMTNCGMTRGGFYAHFTNKAELYREAISFAFESSKLSASQYSCASERTRLLDILNGYLSLEHVSGENPCPFAFLATDIALRDKATRKVFSDAYALVNKQVHRYAKTFCDVSEEEVAALTAMTIGTVALARGMHSRKQMKELLNGCRKQAGHLLGLTLPPIR